MYISKHTTIAVLIALFSVFATACSSDGEETNTQTSSDSTKMLILNVEEDMLKVALSDDAQFTWNGTVQTLYVFFKSADASKTARANGTITIPADWNTTTNKITISVEVPSTFASETGYSVAGAFGVSSMTDDGVATVAQQTETGSSDYTIPFYFPLTATTRGSDGNDYASIHLNRYGSLLKVALTPSTSGLSSVTFKSIDVYTDGLFSTSGTFGVNVESGTTPTYTATDGYTGSKTYTVSSDLGAVTSSTTKYAFIWVKANSTAATRRTIVEAISTTTGLGWTYNKTRSTVLSDGKYYTLTPTATTGGDLIITEIVYIDYRNGIFIEVYNPTSSPVLLSNYDLYSVEEGTYFPLGGSQSSFQKYTSSTATWTTGEQPMILGAGELMVYSSYSIPTYISSTDQQRAFGTSTNYTYYREASQLKFGNLYTASNFNLRYVQGSTDYDVARFYGVAYYTRMRKTTDNTATTSFTLSNWDTQIIATNNTRALGVR